MDLIHTSCLPDHCWKLFCHFLHLKGPLCWPSQKLSTICWMLLSFSLFLSFQFCPIFLQFCPFFCLSMPYIRLQSPTLVCPESSSPAHSLASFRKPECFSSCNSNTTLRFASTTTTTSTHYILNTIRRQEVSTVTGTIIDFLWKLNYPLHQATSTDSIQSIANVLQNRTKQHLADLCHYICAKRQHFRSEDVTLWKRQK